MTTFCTGETRGGGVLIAANQNVPSSQRQLLTDPITIVCGVLCGVYYAAYMFTQLVTILS